ncbi:penicillin-binding protein activator [Thalassotalea sp. PP2-459]|uniref:penicillin-binding protein activator n=1 Tax=Thalassotalea sp. PP2-459 TaxID=1742724 RepID=UPI0009449132|nr:penicillin-binding protein activator [Thalassotalea sp. PP2-459]OKY27339.1 hypothetical protein BI291_00485 [Thalassotalea sp. PP2-459]
MAYHYVSVKRLRVIFSVITLLVLTSCATKPDKKPVKSSDNTQISSNEILTESAKDYLTLAKNSTGETATQYFLFAAQQFNNEKQHKKALWLAQQTQALTDNNRLKYQLELISAQSLVSLEAYDVALNHLNQAKKLRGEQQQPKAFYQTLAIVQQQRQLPLASVDARLRALALSSEMEYQQQANDVWLSLNKLSQWEIQQLSTLAPPYFAGWQQLLNFAHRFGYQSDTFNRYLTQWQRNFRDHPAQILVEKLSATTVQSTDKEHNIAVLLPLSGKQKKAGEVAQQGILAAYQNNSDTTLHFIDSVATDYSTLADYLTSLEVDHVIGPLLKSNVDAYINQSQLNLPTLLLNLPQTHSLKETHIVLSMNPEDEAIQAATTLSRRQFTSPIVFAQQDSISQRIAKTFSEQWQRITGRTPEVIAFADASKVQEKLESTLELDLSKKRIADIDRRIRQQLKTQERNRLDIDMIYIVASPNETRLLKPYIDVNISPFARAIPVFASSRSHSHNSDKSDSRDLSGLSFTEMPWQLTSKQQNASLKQLSSRIWPDRSDSLERIFAMGYDSYSLIHKFSMFKQQPYIRHYGQTGVLKLNEQGILTRSLLWGSYQRDKVEEIVLE